MLRRVLRLRPRRIGLSQARRILVVRPDELGDVVLFSPFLRALRHAAPLARLTLLVKDDCRDLVEHCPYLDEIVSLPFGRGWGRDHEIRLRAAALRLRWQRRWGRGFDLALLPRRDSDWTGAELITHLLIGHGAILAHRETVVKNAAKASYASDLADYTFSNPTIEHETVHNLSFLRWSGATGEFDELPEVWLTESDRQFAKNWLVRRLPRDAPLIIIHPSGGRSPLKQWPRKNFAALCGALLRDNCCEILLLGGPDEPWVETLLADSAKETRAITAVGEFTLRQLAAVLAEASVFVGGDSGPLHLAAAAGTRVVGIFGSTSEARFRPCGTDVQIVTQRLPCSPDQSGTYENRCQSCIYSEPRCLHELSVSTVLTAVQLSLAGCVPQPSSGRTR